MSVAAPKPPPKAVPGAAPVAAAGSPPARPAVAAVGPQVRKLSKGELLFKEGEMSRAMYFVKSGMIRIFKKKGDSDIEIDTVRSGSVLGELAFLDGNPRSASGEALTDCELMEISGPTFQAVLGNIPDWLKILLKTVVGRLRTASTRIRQLEQASTAYTSERDGKRSAQYIYLPPTDVLKILTSILLVGTRNGTKTAAGIEIRVGLLTRYANQIMGVPVAKIATTLDVLAQVGLITNSKMGDQDEKSVLKDADFLEQAITYLNEEYLLEPSKRHDVTLRGLVIMECIAKNLADFKEVDKRTGMTIVNVAGVRARETDPAGKEPFRMEEFPELVKLGYCTQLIMKNGDEAFTQIKPEEFKLALRLQQLVIAIHKTNEARR
ncbi:MAG: cyclic nucleotide-binding domain-containing protein [Bdellovibrionales bacterium]|nr:cyclic nucleotide-binding domain-containing protein [Bdellovibrionales bacterium]